MGPKKTNRSPFGLFMTKLKRTDPELRSMPMSQMVSHCATIYDKLPQEVRKQLDQLSQLVRNSDLNEQQINRRLDQLSLPDNTVFTDNKSNDQSLVGGDDGASTSSANGPPLGVVFNEFTTSDSKRFKDNSFDSDEEVDTFAILQKAFQNSEDFVEQSIVCICFNVLVHTQEDKYYPNEVGITEFSLKDGVRNCFTKLIANSVPDGYYATAKEFSAAFHKLPVNCLDNKDFEDDYELLFFEIYNRMSSSGLRDESNRIIVFCKAEDRCGQSDRLQVMGCLKWLDEKIRSLDPELNADVKPTKSLVDDFVVLDLSDLMFLTIQAYCTTVRPKPMCIEALTRSVFDFHPDLRCDFHSEDENNYCALAVTKRTAYLFFDILFALKLRPGVDLMPTPAHKPTKAVDTSTTYQIFVSERPISQPRPQYRSHTEIVPEKPPNEQLKRLNRSGLGRGRLIQNLKNLQNN